MKQYTLYYSVSNGGDGSAYPRFMESEALCEWDQDHMSEGWGESCTGSFTLQSESDILPVSEIETKESYLFDRYIDDFDEDSNNREIKEFIREFFPDGLPKFTVVTEEIENTPEYLYSIVFDGERRLAKLFRCKEDSGEKFENLLNNLAGKIG